MMDNDITEGAGCDSKIKMGWNFVRKNNMKNIKVIGQRPGGIKNLTKEKHYIGKEKMVGRIGMLGGSGLWSVQPNFFKDVGFLEVKEKDLKYSKGKVSVIIPAAGRDIIFDTPKSVIKIKNEPLLQLQKEILNMCGLNDIVVIRGYKKELFDIEGIKYFDNDDFDKYFILHSLFKAEQEMVNGFIYINSDILFNKIIINNLLNSKKDIILVVDNSYAYHKHEKEPVEA